MSDKSVPSSTSQQSLRRPQKIVYILVGPDQKRFGVHKDVLCEKSRYFKAALDGGFQEATSGRVVLEKEDPDVFGFVVEWLYTKEISKDPCADAEIAVPNILTYVDIWVLADYLQIPGLRNYVMTAIWDAKPIQEEDLEQLVLKPILSEGPFESALARYLVNHFVYNTGKFQADIYKKLAFTDALFAEITVGLTRRFQDTKFTLDPFGLSDYLVPDKSGLGIQFSAEKVDWKNENDDSWPRIGICGEREDEGKGRGTGEGKGRAERCRHIILYLSNCI